MEFICCKTGEENKWNATLTQVCGVGLASFLISPPRLLCPSDQHFVDYRGKLESIMQPSSVPALGFSLSVFVFSWKPSDQGSVGCSPERIMPDKKNHEACPEMLQYKTIYAITECNSIWLSPNGQREFKTLHFGQRLININYLG